MDDPQVSDFMTTSVDEVDAAAPLADAVAIMAQRGRSSVVAMRNLEPVGIVTERDIVRTLATTPSIEALTVEGVMSTWLVSVAPETPLSAATALAREKQVRHLVVRDARGGVVGMLTQTDMLRGGLERIERHRASLEKTVEEQTEALRTANRQLTSLALEDALLGIANRRAMEQVLEQTHLEAERHARPYALVLLDVDHFKAYNDHYGHLRGDDVLRTIATALKGCCRRSDQLFRYGGEEILVVLGETLEGGAKEFAERALKRIEGLALPHAKVPLGHVTVSAGISCHGARTTGASWQEILAEADAALYEAKGAGRNRVAVAGVDRH